MPASIKREAIAAANDLLVLGIPVPKSGSGVVTQLIVTAFSGRGTVRIRCALALCSRYPFGFCRERLRVHFGLRLASGSVCSRLSTSWVTAAGAFSSVNIFGHKACAWSTADLTAPRTIRSAIRASPAIAL